MLLPWKSLILMPLKYCYHIYLEHLSTKSMCLTLQQRCCYKVVDDRLKKSHHQNPHTGKTVCLVLLKNESKRHLPQVNISSSCVGSSTVTSLGLPVNFEISSVIRLNHKMSETFSGVIRLLTCCDMFCSHRQTLCR